MTIKQQGGIFGRNPTFNDVNVDGSLNVNNDNLYVNSNTVGIGTNNPVSLITGGDGPILSIGGTDNVLTNDEKTGTISFITSDGSYKGTYSDGIAAEIACITETATGAGYGLAFYTGVTTASNRAERLRISRSGDVELKTGNLVVPSGNGIDFSATSGTGTSELFDDYEEGNWTPAFDGVTVTYTTQTGTYVKIGSMVYGYCRIVVSSIDNTDGSSVSISGLPYNPAVTGNGGGTFNVGYNQTPLFNSTAADDVTGLNFSTGGSFQFGDASYQFFRRYVDLCNASGELLVSFFYRAS